MSYLLTRIRRALTEPPEEPLTRAINVALAAHWKSLYDSDPEHWKCLGENLPQMEKAVGKAQEADHQVITTELALWEAKRAALQLDATLGGAPGAVPTLQSQDWGTHWILFHWEAPKQGGLPWGYRVERSADQREFYPVEICLETETTLVHQPQGPEFYYRVIAFNGHGDGPASPFFAVTFDNAIMDLAKKDEADEDADEEAQADDEEADPE